MLPEQRRRQILALLSETGGVDVPLLADRLSVSAATIRRDLTSLQASGQLERTHGGAVPMVGGTAYEPRYSLKRSQRLAEKEAIARHAAELVPDGSVVVLDSGSTTFALARELKRRHGLTVITVDLQIAIELADRPGLDVIAIGGRVRPELFGVVGPMSESGLADLHADLAFLGADAIDPVAGVTNANLDEVAVKRAILAAARETHLLADASKFGQVSLAKVADVRAFSSIITDEGLDPAFASSVRDAGASLDLAPLPGGARADVP
jgi:DeoR family transcriptional regulator, aga operon transcriptional repressor